MQCSECRAAAVYQCLLQMSSGADTLLTDLTAPSRIRQMGLKGTLCCAPLPITMRVHGNYNICWSGFALMFTTPHYPRHIKRTYSSIFMHRAASFIWSFIWCTAVHELQ